MTKYLFDGFDKVTPKAWKQKIQVDLKGKDYNDTLLWKTEENIIVKPFYTKEDRTNQQINLPKEEFKICESIFIDDEVITNQIAINAIMKGATAIQFIIKKTFNIEKVLKNIPVSKITLYFHFYFLDTDFVAAISKYINSKKCYFNIDIIGDLAKNGNWHHNLKEDHKKFETIINSNNNCIGVNSDIYQNAGANCTQQLAYALAHANEYLNYYGADVFKKIHFNFSVGGNYFFEISKLRAFRLLWSSLLKEYDIHQAYAHVFTQPSLRNKTLYDYNVNILRTTSECMSAAMGGANTISNITYDEFFHKSNEFGKRISRNQLLILKEESSIGNPQHFADGSYYIESLTNQLAENALEIFKLIEKGGGFLKQLKEGTIQKKINESAEKEQNLFDAGKLVLVGTNIVQNHKNKMKDELDLFPFIKKRNIKTLIQPIIRKRLAEKNEQERLKNE